ncbi:MAG: hypothetical protein NW224_17040 [Leptolyngbyaceae cyanobacterium bins.302]|nr:hypothetical protein [Leptolyngbyaceae cyanobacterium bins.302]
MPRLQVHPHPDCPSCGSRDTRRLSTLYEEGTASFNISGFSWNGGIFAGGGTHSTQLAKRIAPPFRANPGACWIWAGLLGWLLAVIAHYAIGLTMVAIDVVFHPPLGIQFIMGTILQGLGPATVVAIILITLWAIRKQNQVNQQYDKEVYFPAYNQWERSYRCNRCGSVFDPANSNS